jgi:hypothetical protein
MKNLFILLILLGFNPLFGQSTAEERWSTLTENFTIVQSKLENESLTLEDENYKICKKMISKMKSYDKYTTMKTEEFIALKASFDGIAPFLKTGKVYLSKTKDGKTPSVSFVAGQPMFLILNCGMTTVKNSLNDGPSGSSEKTLNISFQDGPKSGHGKIYHQVPADKLGDNYYVVDLTLNGTQKDFKDVYTYLGSLGLGVHQLNIVIARGEFVSTIGTNVPFVKMPISLEIKDKTFSEIADKVGDDEYKSIVLDKAVVYDADLEFMLISLFHDAYPEYNFKKLNVIEDWYELKDNGRLSFMKMNCHIAVKDDNGNCYRVYVGFVKENMADVGVKLSAIKILETGAKLKFTKMPCENIQ